VVLEDSELLNAGTGSELNSEGKVECDAGYMSGSGYFGGVGAIPGCPNPILVARKIAQLNLTREDLIPGAVPPM
jgi:taspase (threonine aspartase 1)